MAEATPGPWSRDAVTSQGQQDVILGYTVPTGGHPILVATCYHDDSGGPGDISMRESEANARLIASAPDLLAACKAAQQAMRAISRNTKDLSGELDLLRRAIDKAEVGK